MNKTRILALFILTAMLSCVNIQKQPNKIVFNDIELTETKINGTSFSIFLPSDWNVYEGEMPKDINFILIEPDVSSIGQSKIALTTLLKDENNEEFFEQVISENNEDLISTFQTSPEKVREDLDLFTLEFSSEGVRHFYSVIYFSKPEGIYSLYMTGLASNVNPSNELLITIAKGSGIIR